MANDRNDSPPGRRGSVTSAAFSNLFQRSNSTTTAPNNGSGSVTSAIARDQQRRLSVTTLGLSGTSPNPTTTPFGLRRGSMSTNNSDSIDESAVDDDESSSARTAPVTPFSRRVSFGAQAMRSVRQGTTSPGSNGTPGPTRRSPSGTLRTPPSASTVAQDAGRSQASTAPPARTPSDMPFTARADQGFNWSEQLRSRAESSVSSMARPSFGAGASVSPPRANPVQHDRAKSVSDMPAPPQQAAAMKPKPQERPKPDHMQERILKGDFYMD